jgi:hypothetical protein
MVPLSMAVTKRSPAGPIAIFSRIVPGGYVAMVLFPALRLPDAPESSPLLLDRAWAPPRVASSEAAEIEISAVLRALITFRKKLHASALIGLSFSL